MTWYKPTLILSRLIITKSSGLVYDERFHLGLNVIRGKNSSGKTTIAKAISYGLGGDVKNWTRELLVCDFVISEVIINRQYVTLRRPISKEKNNHMEIYWGNYAESAISELANWEKYPYSTYQNKSGFSKVLFSSFGLPEVKGYQASNLTMHQILRLMYGDQSSPANRIIATEDFDSVITREAIGDLLCGIYSDELFNARIELGKFDKDLSACVSQLNSLYQILGKQHSDLTTLDIEAEIRDAEQRLVELQASIDERKNKGYIKDSDPKNIELKKSLKKNKDKLFVNKERIVSLEFDLADSEIFIHELKNKLLCMDDSMMVSEVISSIDYKSCPACFSDLSGQVRKKNECSLCGSEFHEDSPRVNIHKMRNEIQLQVKESSTLLEGKREELSILLGETQRLKKDVRSLERRYKDVSTDMATSHQKVLQQYYREIGYLDRSIEDLFKNKDIIDQIKTIATTRDQLNLKINELRDIIAIKSLEQKKQRHEIADKLSDEIVKILKQDLDRQDHFSEAEYVIFDFGSNSISVNGESTFSESSTVYLKNAFLLAMLSVSAQDNRVRFPRFLLLDGIENGGMEQERSHNLQRVILGLSDVLEVDHQIIITTAEIAPELEGSAATVGQFYTTENKSLNFISAPVNA